MEQQIIKTACEAFGVSESELYSKIRRQVKSDCKKAISYLLYKEGLTQSKIANLLNQAQRSICTQIESANALIETNKEFKNKVIQIMDRSLK